ncbi:hypothetical protein D3C72_1636750 [compost metagenome]
MRDEACSLDVVAVHQHELFLLRWRNDFFVVFVSAQRTVDQCHAHGLAFGVSEGQTVAAGELRQLRGRADELVDHLALGDFDAAQVDREAQLFGIDPHLDFTDANFPGERVIAAITALGGITQRQ